MFWSLLKVGYGNGMEGVLWYTVAQSGKQLEGREDPGGGTAGSKVQSWRKFACSLLWEGWIERGR